MSSLATAILGFPISLTDTVPYESLGNQRHFLKVSELAEGFPTAPKLYLKHSGQWSHVLGRTESLKISDTEPVIKVYAENDRLRTTFIALVGSKKIPLVAASKYSIEDGNICLPIHDECLSPPSHLRS